MALVQAEQNDFVRRAAQWPAAVKNYVDELKMEMRRVTWPNMKQVRATTTVVIASVFMFAAYFFVVDFFVNKGISKLFAAFAR